MNRIVRTSLVVASLALSLVAARPAGADPLRPAPSAAPRRFVPRHAWGFAQPLRSIALRPDQQLEAQRIEGTVTLAGNVARSTMIDFLQALSAQVNANAIDAAALRPKMNAAAHAAEAEWRAARGADQRLHDLLDRPQRVALVDKAEEIFRYIRPGGAPPPPSSLPWLPSGVTLTREQEQRLAAAFGPPAPPPSLQAVLDDMKRDLEAFKADRYVRASLADRLPRPWEGYLGFVDAARKILGVLTPEQRAVVARSFAENASEGAMVL